MLVVAFSSSVSGQEMSYDLFAKTVVEKEVSEVKANRLLVITEPSWCYWCKILEPHLREVGAWPNPNQPTSLS